MGRKHKNITSDIVDKPAINASSIHEGARLYSKAIRTSEVLGSYNLDPKFIVGQYDRWMLVNKSRFFVENIPIVKSALEDIATYSVGESWLPIYQGEDKAWGIEATNWLNNWFQICDRDGSDMLTNLWLASLALDRDGDILCHLTYADDGKYPQMQLIPSHRIASQDTTVTNGTYKGLDLFDGVILNSNNKPTAYNIITSGDLNTNAYGTVSTNNSTQISIQDSVLIYEPRYPLQFRGNPTLATSLNYWLDYRDVQNFEFEAIKQAASIALIETNEIGGVLPGQQIMSPTSSIASNTNTGLWKQYYDGGTRRYFGTNAPGAGLKQMENNRPGEQTQVFLREHVLRPALASLGWPIEMIDPSSMGSANTRAILGKVDRKITQRQAALWKMYYRVIKYAIAKAIKLGILKQNVEWYKWTCTTPARPSIDISRESKQAIELYKLGGTTLSDICGIAGQNWKDVIDQKIAEMAYIKVKAESLGIDPEKVQQTTPNGNPVGSNDTTDNQNA